MGSPAKPMNSGLASVTTGPRGRCQGIPMGRSRLVMLAAAIPLMVLAACSTSSEPSDTAAGEPSATVQDPDNDADTGEAEEEGKEGGRTEAENEAQEELSSPRNATKPSRRPLPRVR